MKVAISATGPNLQADVDPRFGRCQYLIFVDTDTMAFEAQNNANINAGGGAGIATAQAVADHGVQAVITGNMGPKAHKVLSQAGINIFAGASGTVEKAIEDYKNNRLKEASSATVEEHAGMSPPPKKPDLSSSEMRNEIEMLKGRANTMKQQLDNLIFRIEELER